MKSHLVLVLAILLSGWTALSVASAWGRGLSQEIAQEREHAPAPPIFGVEEPRQKGEPKGSLKKPTEQPPESSGLSADQVKKIQEALQAEGHDPGPIDGKFGPQTKRALQSFLSARGLKDIGTIDEETLKQLSVQGGEDSVPHDLPPSSTGN